MKSLLYSHVIHEITRASQATANLCRVKPCYRDPGRPFEYILVRKNKMRKILLPPKHLPQRIGRSFSWRKPFKGLLFSGSRELSKLCDTVLFSIFHDNLFFLSSMYYQISSYSPIRWEFWTEFTISNTIRHEILVRLWQAAKMDLQNACLLKT